MNNSTAFQSGQVVGTVLGVLILLGLFAAFPAALLRAIRTRSKGWIIGAAFASIPYLFLLLAFALGLVRGFQRASHGGAGFSGRNLNTADLLTANMTSVTGSNYSYQISYPWIDSWKRLDTSNQSFDQLYTYHDAYVGVIFEGIGVGDPRRVCDLSQKLLASKATEHTFKSAHPVQIDGRDWLTYDTQATVNGMHVDYRNFCFADSNCTVQIVDWTSPLAFTSDAPVFDRIAKSFQFPR